MHIKRQIGFRSLGQRWLSSALLSAVLVTGMQASSALAAIGRDWTTRNPLPTGESINAVVSNDDPDVNGDLGTRLVAVGNQGIILTSDDGVTWTNRTSGVTADLLSVVWAPNALKYMAVGTNSTALTSPDGITWTAKPALGTDRLVSVAYTGTRFLAVGTNGAVGSSQWIETNGTTWTRTVPPPDPMLQVVDFSTSVVFAINTKTVLRGDFGAKGLVWSKLVATGLTAADLPRSLVVAPPNLLVSVLNAGVPGILRSSSGTSWSAVTLPTQPTVPLRLSRAGAEVIAVGPAGDVWLSANGLTGWTHPATGQNVELFGGAKISSNYVAVGQGGRIYTTTDSSSSAVWTGRLSTGPVTKIAGATSNGTGFVGVGEDFSVTSSDGLSWVDHAQTSKAMRSVAYTGSLYVAVGDGIWTSPDGIAWTETASLEAFGPLNRVIWTGTQLVAVGADGTGKSLAITSTDGATWSAGAIVAPVPVKKLNGISSFGGLLAAVGDGGQVLTSPNFGLNWTKTTVVLKAGEHFLDVAFGNNVFVAVTNLGGIWSSASGTKWVNRKVASSGALNRVLWVGNQFAAVGDQGKEAYSFGGVDWVIANAGSSQNLMDLALSNTLLATVGTSGAVLTSGGGAPQRPTVAFELQESFVANETAGIVDINVTLLPASPLPVTVLYTLSGTAAQGTTAASDYTHKAVPLVFAAGETSKKISLTIKQDALDEVDEIVYISLGAPTGDAVLGAPYDVHTFTIQDDDQLPTFTAQPSHLLVHAGTSPVFTSTVAASGTPGSVLTAQWKKNNAAAAGIVTGTAAVASPAGATFSATFTSVATTHAGAYTVVAKNPTGSATSAIAQLGVVENIPQVLTLAADATATLTVKAAGNGLSYQWLKDGYPISNSTNLRITGTTTIKLVIKDMSLADNGTYACRVTQTTTTGSNSILGATTILGVAVSAPVITATSLPATVVGQPYDYTITATGNPNRWTLVDPTKLPAGLTFNTVTGRITGQVNEAISSTTVYGDIAFTASNLVGTGPTKVLSLQVGPLPANALGDFAGTIERKPALNAGLEDVSQFGLGGRVALSLASSGSYTCNVKQGSATYTLTGVATYNPVGPVVQIVRELSGQGVRTSTLNLTINPATRTITGNTNNAATGGSDVAVFTGWRSNLWEVSPPSATALVRRAAKYTMFHTPPTSDQFRPAGHSYVAFEVNGTNGVYTAAGMLADGTAYSLTGVMGATGQIPLYAGMYTKPGSMTGTVTINEVADTAGGYLRNTVTGDLQWNKPDQGASSADRVYKAGFQNLLTLKGSTAGKPNGGRYVPPVLNPPVTPQNEYTRIFMGMNETENNNGKFTFNANGIDLLETQRLELNEEFSVPAGENPVAQPMPGGNLTQLTINASTGVFSGTFSVTEQNPLNTSTNITRTIPVYGVAVRDNVTAGANAVWFGRGFCLVPRRPEPGIPGPTTLANSRIQSGAVLMTRNP